MSLSIGDGGQGKGIRYKERETPYFTKTYPMHIPEYVLIRKKPAVRKRGPQAFCAWGGPASCIFLLLCGNRSCIIKKTINRRA